MKPFIFNTKNNNFYLYSPTYKELVSCNKDFAMIIDEFLQGHSLDITIEKLKSIDKNLHSFFMFLYENKFLSQSNSEIENQITENQIFNNLVNVTQLVFEVTEICNLNCSYCGFGEMYNQMDRDKSNLSFQSAKVLIDYILELKQKVANLSYKYDFRFGFYGGEPLLNFPLIQEIVDYTKKLHIENINFCYGLTTNGIDLLKYIDYLVKHDFKLLVSLDGNAKNSSYRIFKNNTHSFEIVYNNLKTIKTNFPVFFENNISFNSVLHDRNSVEEIYNFFQKEFEKIPKISELHNGNIDDKNLSVFQNKFKSSYKEIEKIKNQTVENELFIKSPRIKSLTDLIFNYSNNVFQDYYCLNYDIENKSLLTGTCTPFSRKIFLTAKNLLLPCEKIHHKFSIGNIKDNTVNIDLKWIASFFNKKINEVFNQCCNCSILEKCHQCVFTLPQNKEKALCNTQRNETYLKKIFSERIAFLEDNPEYYDKIMNEVVIR